MTRMEMKRAMIKCLAFFLVFQLTACGSSKEASNMTGKSQGGQKVKISKEIENIPDKYMYNSEEPGTLVDFYYDTYESFSYNEKSKTLKKHAIIYLPYGYNKNKKYDVFYLMHGGWGDETTTLGTPQNPSSFKSVIDNAIATGEVKPVIIVCPTYNNTNNNGLDSNNYSLAMQLTENYHNELINDLIPKVEGTYSTYAKSESSADLIDSRNHRGFGGFSMGSVATWRTFQYGLEYFSYFLPMSCGTSLNNKEIFAAAKGYKPNDYFVFIMTGTDDFAYDYDKNRVNLMKNSEYFSDIDDNPIGNFAFRVKKGYSHDGKAATEYIYNGLKTFWSGDKATEEDQGTVKQKQDKFTINTKIKDVISDSAFGDYGRLIFPTNKGYYSGDTLGNLSLMWYGKIKPDRTVNIVNYMKDNSEAGNAVFYDIYSDEEKAKNPNKKDTGLFFFRGNKGARTAIVNAGGGFAFVGAMQDSFPHALVLSQKGYNAFALIYRPEARTACEDLARAIAFLHKNADKLGISMEDYSLWGGSAGARMTAWLGNYGTERFGENAYPRPAAVIMEYTGLSEVTGTEPPTYACVGTDDGIASYRIMQNRIDRIKANGTDAKIEIFKGLSHGFGLGEGTVAEGWINHAVEFWEKQM